jgi:signal transduction histidine kinase
MLHLSSFSLKEDESVKSWKLEELIDGYLRGRFVQHLNPANKCLDLQCTYSDEVREMRVVIALSILSSDSGSGALTIVVKDITKHNELLDMEIKERFKSKVINSFSHELRTPLNGA